jgi:hypothetical protein
VKCINTKPWASAINIKIARSESLDKNKRKNKNEVPSASCSQNKFLAKKLAG